MLFAQININRYRNGALLVLQVALFCLLAALCHMLVLWAQLPIPASVLGLGILLILLSTGLLPEGAVQLGATWLIGELLLFFIPPVISIIQYDHLFADYGANILLTLVLGSGCVMVGTGWVVDRVFKFERQRHLKQRSLHRSKEY
ncbi:MAG: CidA/LrgA family protein [Shewanella sp.]